MNQVNNRVFQQDDLLQENLDRVQELTEELMTEDSHSPLSRLTVAPSGRNSTLDLSGEVQLRNIRRQNTYDEGDMLRRKEIKLQDEVKQNLQVIGKLNDAVQLQDNEISDFKTQLKVVHQEYAEFKLQSQFDYHRLEEQLEDMKANQADNSETERLRTEGDQLKESLMQYWTNLSKTLNDEFEEILQMGVSSDAKDIMSALLMIQEARQEQDNADKVRIQELEAQVAHLLEENEKIISNSQNESFSKIDQISPQLRRELDEVKELKNKLYENMEIKQMYEQQRQMIEKMDHRRALEIKINDLTSESQQQQQDKMNQISTLNAEIIHSKERELQTLRNLTERDKQLLQQEQIIEFQKVELNQRKLSNRLEFGTHDQALQRNISNEAFQSSLQISVKQPSPLKITIKQLQSEHTSPKSNQKFSYQHTPHNQRFPKNQSFQQRSGSDHYPALQRIISSTEFDTNRLKLVAGDHHSKNQNFGVIKINQRI